LKYASSTPNPATAMVKTPSQPRPIPPLENGDRLTRYEFERRYATMPQHKKAELIEGVVYMAAALRFRSHGEPHSNIMGWLWTYKIATLGVALGDAPTVRLDSDNEPQPDAVLLIEEQYGGRSRVSEDDYIEGVPELVVEIAASSAAIDPEYIVWQVFDRKVDWFCWQEGEYISLPIDADGTIRSRIFPGLWLAVEDLLAGNMVRVLAVLQSGLVAAEHSEFVQQLSQVGG
jgi:Uma2 family endonuclease